jgi:hypothetical protein
MTTYVPVPDGDIDQDSPGTQPLFTALRDNPIAIAEGATIAPYNHYAWHPYNGTNVGDGATGLIYDFAVSGAVTLITSPDFVDGYEYRFMFDMLSSSVTNFTVNLWRETAGAYAGATDLMSGITAGTSLLRGFVEILQPRRISNWCNVVPVDLFAQVASTNAVNTGAIPTVVKVSHTTAQKILRAQFSKGLLGGGRVYMHKRLGLYP